MSDKLVLTIEVDEMGTEGWRDLIDGWQEDIGAETFQEAMMDDVRESLCREEVHVVMTTLPGEKSLNDDFEVIVKPGRIIGADLRAVGPSSDGGDG